MKFRIRNQLFGRQIAEPRKRRSRPPLVRAAAGVVILAMCPAWPAAAYQTPLDGKALHEAYILGQRNDQNTGDFLATYIKQMTEGHSDLRVAEIELLTPYAQVVDDSRKNTSGYSEEQAAQQYQKTGNTLLLSVTLMLPAAYPQATNGDGSANSAGNPAASPGTDASNAAPSSASSGAATGQPPSAAHPGEAKKPENDPQSNSNLRPENFWQSFQFYFKQNGKNIPSKSVHNKPIYSTATKDAPAVLDGAAVLIEFDAKDVASQEAVVEVTTPDGKTISATFDLKKLR